MSHDLDTPVTRLLRWHAGETPGPWQLHLFPTNRCNLRCKTCWQRSIEFATDREVPDDRLLALADEAAALGVKEWFIIGGGEPMARGDLVIRLCERIRERGMDGVLHTNGTLFKPAHLESLVRMGWGRVKVSLDGPTAAVNDPIRGEGAFERATGNIRRLTELKREQGVSVPTVALHPTLVRQNFEKAGDIIELARDLGC